MRLAIFSFLKQILNCATTICVLVVLWFLHHPYDSTGSDNKLKVLYVCFLVCLQSTFQGLRLVEAVQLAAHWLTFMRQVKYDHLGLPVALCVAVLIMYCTRLKGVRGWIFSVHKTLQTESTCYGLCGHHLARASTLVEYIRNSLISLFTRERTTTRKSPKTVEILFRLYSIKGTEVLPCDSVYG